MLDKISTGQMADSLRGKKIAGWTIIDYINHGKSAVILKANKDGLLGALKLFDKDIINRYGQEAQLARVEREKKLIGATHPHLIKILDGGLCEDTGYIFIAMQYLPHKNLGQVIEYIPRDKIYLLIRQIASAVKFLEENGIAHRDIKPENIAISDDFTNATLLDTSVIKLIGLAGITDENDQKAFIGTLRYSPPELLYRREKDNPQGWQAINFYQLGAVLHDLIMQYPIFRDFSEPYANLVDAVREIKPEINASDVDIKLIMLARSCLVKDPEMRLSLVSWDDFLGYSPSADNRNEVMKRIKRRIKIAEDSHCGTSTAREAKFIRKSGAFRHIVDEVKESIRTICVDNSDYLPPLDENKIIKCEDSEAEIRLCLEPSIRHNVSVALTLLIRISCEDFAENIIYVSYAAFASKNCPVCIENGFLNLKTVFKGSYDVDAVKADIYELLLRLIDAGQELDVKKISEQYIEVEPIQ